MYAPDGGPNGPQELPDELIERLDELDERSLWIVSRYVDELLDAHRTPTPEEVRQDAHGEVLDVEDRGAYALVKKRIPCSSDSDAPRVSMFHVTRERTPSGESNLHWEFMRDVSDSSTECANCGASLPEDANRCIRCGDRTTRYDGGER